MFNFAKTQKFSQITSNLKSLTIFEGDPISGVLGKAQNEFSKDERRTQISSKRFDFKNSYL